MTVEELKFRQTLVAAMVSAAQSMPNQMPPSATMNFQSTVEFLTMLGLVERPAGSDRVGERGRVDRWRALPNARLFGVAPVHRARGHRERRCRDASSPCGQELTGARRRQRWFAPIFAAEKIGGSDVVSTALDVRTMREHACGPLRFLNVEDSPVFFESCMNTPLSTLDHGFEGENAERSHRGGRENRPQRSLFVTDGAP